MLPGVYSSNVQERTHSALTNPNGKHEKTSNSPSLPQESIEEYREALEARRAEAGFKRQAYGELCREWMIWNLVSNQIIELGENVGDQRSNELVNEIIKITGLPFMLVIEAIAYIKLDCNAVSH
jgi:hypothetical protein